MDSNQSNTKRIKLEGDKWATIRTNLTFADIRAQQLQRALDGRTEYDAMLDAMSTFKTRIIEWDIGTVDDGNINALSPTDTMTLVRAILGLEDDEEAERPNGLAPSSAGQTESKARKNRGSGDSEK